MPRRRNHGACKNLTGPNSLFSGERWLVLLDLTAKSFVPGRNLYDRVLSCLQEKFPPVEMLVSRVQGERTTEVTFPSEIESRPFTLASTNEFWDELEIPVFDSETKFDDDFLLEIHNWSGALFNTIPSYLNPKLYGTDSFASSFAPLISTTPGVGTSYKWKGFITPSFISKQIALLKTQLDSGEIPWALVMVWGFEDTPLSWKECQHYFQLSGENDYTILLLPGGNYIMYAAVGPHDEFS